MGLIKAVVGSVGGTLADQWLDYIYCDSIDANTLLCKGQKRSSGRSSNVHGEDNVISNGSAIAVADGQCMIVVQQGKVVELCAEPGIFEWNSSLQPSIFTGDLKQGVIDTFNQMVERFTYGGGAGQDQRVYYVNTKEIVGNKYGTASPVPFRVVDRNAGIDIDISLRCNGEYSYRIVDPILFYKSLAGNVSDVYLREQIDSQLKTELLTALQPAFARLGAAGMRYSEIPAHVGELAEILNAELDVKWNQQRGIVVESFGMNSITASEEDAELIKRLQANAALSDPNARAAFIAAAQGEAMRVAAGNENGAMAGFMGMGMAAGMAAGMGGMGMGAQAAVPAPAAAPAPAPAADGWTCACGTVNTGKFCGECGSAKPEPWTCACGDENTGKFCDQCGAPKPVAWTCACGASSTGKFCPECGAPRP